MTVNNYIFRLFRDTFSTFDNDDVITYYSRKLYNVKPYIHGSKYISLCVRKNIINKMNILNQREYLFNNTRVTTEIYSSKDVKSLEEFHKLLNFYILVLNKVRYCPDVKIIVYLTNLKKRFPMKSILLNEDNVNSGLTTFDGDNKQIVIYRKEELNKVLLHELIHYYMIDFHFYNNKYDMYYINKYGIKVSEPFKNVSNPLALYETYTDTLACYGNIITYCLFKKKKILGVFEEEKQHYMLQAAKVYKFSKLRENTHCFSYYIGKAAIFFNFDRFIEQINNNENLLLDNSMKIEHYFKTLKKSIDNELFWKSIKNQRVGDKGDIVLSSLCMSNIKW